MGKEHLFIFSCIKLTSLHAHAHTSRSKVVLTREEINMI